MWCPELQHPTPEALPDASVWLALLLDLHSRGGAGLFRRLILWQSVPEHRPEGLLRAAPASESCCHLGMRCKSWRVRAPTERAAWGGVHPAPPGTLCHPPSLPDRSRGGGGLQVEIQTKAARGKKESERKQLGARGRHLQGQHPRGEGKEWKGPSEKALRLNKDQSVCLGSLSAVCTRLSKEATASSYFIPMCNCQGLRLQRGGGRPSVKILRKSGERRFTELTVCIISWCKRLFLLQTEQWVFQSSEGD